MVVRGSVVIAIVIGLGVGGCSDDGGGQSPGDGGGQVIDDGDGGSSTGGRPQPAQPMFDDTMIHDIALTMSPEDWLSIIDDTRGDEWRHATITYDGIVVEDVGVRPAGESSRMPGNPKMAMRIKFDAFAGRGKFGGKKAIKIDGMPADQSMMRERLAFFVFRSMVRTPREAAGRLTVNGDLRGHYTVIEVWDSESVEDHFPPPIGPLYRIRGLPPGMTLPDADPYLYRGPDVATYVPYPWEPHVNMPARGDDVIPGALGALTSPAALEGVMDVETLLGFLACNTVVMNTDGLAGDTDIEDHFQYFDPSTGKFVVLPWDPDNTFGAVMETPDRYIYARFSRTVPTTMVRDDPDLNARYKAKIREVMAKVPIGALHAEADRIHQQITDVVYQDPVKPFGNDSFEWSYGYVKDFAAQRYQYLQGEVAN